MNDYRTNLMWYRMHVSAGVPRKYAYMQAFLSFDLLMEYMKLMYMRDAEHEANT